MEVPLKNPAELASRLDLTSGNRLLLVDPPAALEDTAIRARQGKGEIEIADSRKLRSVKETFDAVVIWREDRVGSQAVFESLVKRLDPRGFLWAVVALRKVTGVATPAAHRLDLSDLTKAFSPAGLKLERETRVSPWHVAYRFGHGAAGRPQSAIGSRQRGK